MGTTPEQKKAIGMLGQAAIRTGVFILRVPDPLPLVDELVAVTLIAGGAAAVYYSRTGSPPPVVVTKAGLQTITQSPGVITSPTMHAKSSSKTGAYYSSGTSFLDDSWRLEYESNR